MARNWPLQSTPPIFRYVDMDPICVSWKENGYKKQQSNEIHQTD